jgi:lipoic acid synthetase
MGPEFQQMRTLVKGESLHTVCQEAGCPNIYECWQDREASFLICGAICTRRCAFCDIAHGHPDALDPDEPRRVAESVRTMGLRYTTITGVTRDDLPDQGAAHWVRTVETVRELNPDCGIEILPDDFQGNPDLLDQVFASRPQVFAHNLETVPRLMKTIRPAFRYERTLGVLSRAKRAGLVTKSNLILGQGETTEEVLSTLQDLRDAGCDIITITQYLRPTKYHRPVQRWVKPEEFVELRDAAREIGFPGVLSGPLVRSSYRSGRLWARAMKALGMPIPENLRSLADEGFAQAV